MASNRPERHPARPVPAGFTGIARTERIHGCSIPGIIRNGGYFFTRFAVYADGLIDCWGMLDGELLRDKLLEGWVACGVPDGKRINVHELGSWGVTTGTWTYSNASFEKFVANMIGELNPRRENLKSLYGTNTEVIAGVAVSKHASSPIPRPLRAGRSTGPFPEQLSGKSCSVFYRPQPDTTFLCQLSVFSDGSVEIADLEQTVVLTSDEVRPLIDEGKLLTDPATGTMIRIHPLGSFVIGSGEGISIDDWYTDFLDARRELLEGENSVQRCVRLLAEYKKAPTWSRLADLRDAYEAITPHRRRYVGDMDTKDYEVRRTIYGPAEKQRWEAERGYVAPDIDIVEPGGPAPE